MTDLEITQLCSEAIGYRPGLAEEYREGRRWRTWQYDPLHDNAQAMALVKKFRLDIESPLAYPSSMKDPWIVRSDDHPVQKAIAEDLNRAICECVSQMQLAKQKVAA